MAPPVASWLGARSDAVKAEFSLPWGICDFVGVSVDRRRARQRIAMGQRAALGPAWRVRLLHQIPEVETGKAASFGSLARRSEDSLPAPQLRAELDWLEKHRFVQRTARGGVQRLNGWAPLQRKIIAVEMKLSRVQEALAQAHAHRRFASEVYVALPACLAFRVARSDRRAPFNAYGIGLLAVWQERARIVIQPAENVVEQPDPIAQFHCVERFWRSHRHTFA